MFLWSWLIVFLVSAVSAWIIRHVLSRRRLWKLASKIPGPPGLPVIGNALSLMGSPEETFNRLKGWFREYGSVYRVWIGTNLYVLVSDPAAAQIVLQGTRLINRDDNVARAIGTFFGNGLLSSRGDTWRQHRKVVAPAFNYKVLESYIHVFGNKANVLADMLSELADGREVDVLSHLSMCMLDALSETALGHPMNIQSTSGSSEFATGLITAERLIHNRALNPWLLLEWLYPFTSDGRQAVEVTQKINGFSETIIARKLQEYRDRDVSCPDPSEVKADKKMTSFLDKMIESSEQETCPLTPAEIRDEVSTMAAAGMETTATTLAYVLVLLGMHPECQDKLGQELLEIFSDSQRRATVEDVHNMRYMDYVIKETLRLFPSVTLLFREVAEEVEITRGYVLPVGSSVLVCSYMMHHDDCNFCDPERFWPERWSPEHSAERHAGAYLPFGVGARNCVGQKYAMLNMKTVLSCLLRRYRVVCQCYTMEDLNRLEVSVSIKCTVGHKIQLYKKC